MEKYTVSRELAQKLKDADYPQKTIYAWADETKVENAYYFEDIDGYVLLMNKGLLSDYYEYGYQPIAAPLSDELLEQLKELEPSLSIVANPSMYKLHMAVKHTLGKAIAYVPFMRMGDYPATDKPADALALLWLWCKANGHLKPKGSEES